MDSQYSFGEVSFFYHRTEKYDVTVAYQRDSKEKVVKFGATFCHPDDEFSKRMGRKIASDRLTVRPSYKTDKGNSNRHETHCSILASLTSSDYAPNRFSKKDANRE